MPDPPPAGAARGLARDADLRGHVGDPRRRGRRSGIARQTGPPATDWEAAAALADPAARPLLAALSARGAPAPEVGFELADDRGAVRAEAELAWPAAQVAVLLAGRETDAAAFRAAGWQVFAAGTENLAERLAGVFDERTENEAAR